LQEKMNIKADVCPIPERIRALCTSGILSAVRPTSGSYLGFLYLF